VDAVAPVGAQRSAESDRQRDARDEDKPAAAAAAAAGLHLHLHLHACSELYVCVFWSYYTNAKTS
jgi:hypothetical protein